MLAQPKHRSVFLGILMPMLRQTVNGEGNSHHHECIPKAGHSLSKPSASWRTVNRGNSQPNAPEVEYGWIEVGEAEHGNLSQVEPYADCVAERFYGISGDQDSEGSVPDAPWLRRRKSAQGKCFFQRAARRRHLLPRQWPSGLTNLLFLRRPIRSAHIWEHDRILGYGTNSRMPRSGERIFSFRSVPQ